ncbi:hypothetical protein O181_062056 [Austropuccinia psidii MF-1]|uniref:Uncharacterized protein n=1 Tax=Austropuccinia psidii MF-1 TaxID=1389203 RepID=A0A9Q3HY45_9BASI|nr:hypothetical protein [Austropuccinia psidii MF-1]
MHNWYEGVLQHHFRFRWGLNEFSKKNSSEETKDDTTGGPILEKKDESEGDFFSDGFKKLLLCAIGEVVVPTGITPMPKRIGIAKNGKLKASEWHSLFSIYLPLSFLDTLLQFQTSNEDMVRYQIVLENLGFLIQCTNIVSSKSYKEDDAISFQREYDTYTQTSASLFSNQRVLPNHHYALHIPEQMR